MGGFTGGFWSGITPPLQKHPSSHRCAGSRAPLAHALRGALRWGPPSSPLPSLTLFDVLLQLLITCLPFDEPWGDTVRRGPRCLLGIPRAQPAWLPGEG